MKDRPTNWYQLVARLYYVESIDLYYLSLLGKERTKKGKMIIHEETHEVETPTGPMRVRLFKPRCGDEKGSAPTSSHAALACLPPALYSGAPLSRCTILSLACSGTTVGGDVSCDDPPAQVSESH